MYRQSSADRSFRSSASMPSDVCALADILNPTDKARSRNRDKEVLFIEYLLALKLIIRDETSRVFEKR